VPRSVSVGQPQRDRPAAAPPAQQPQRVPLADGSVRRPHTLEGVATTPIQLFW
jgi:hypothetical protein